MGLFHLVSYLEPVEISCKLCKFITRFSIKIVICGLPPARYQKHVYFCRDGFAFFLTHCLISLCYLYVRGYKRFFRRTTLETSDFLKDDCLTMHCTVGVVRTRVERPKQYTISIPPSDIGQSLKDLLESEVGCDITFQVADETFKAHKLILAARSPVFRAQFFGLVGNPNMDKVVVEDVEPSIFKVMFHISLLHLMRTKKELP